MKMTSRRAFLYQLSALTLAARGRAHASSNNSVLFAGTYTDDKGSTSKGIYAFLWDADAGALSPLGLVAATTNPSFLTLTPDGRYLYAVNEVKNGSIASYSVHGKFGKLKPINVVSSNGAGPCKITVDYTGSAAFVANYDSGSAASYRILPNGALTKAVSTFQYTGHGADVQRQTAPHAHCTTVSPNNSWVVINDLGLDRVSVYHLDAKTAQLTPNDPPFYQALPGSGPRSFVFHPAGKWAYSLNEINSTLDALAWDNTRGTLTRMQNISTLPKGFSGENTSAQVVIDAAGRFVYASNRGDDSIAVFAVDDRDGQLTCAQRVKCGGKTPRHFALDPGNQWLLVANEDSSNIVVFARNGHTGQLTQTDNQYPISHPVCLVFG
jgi:6-phosphogluconolactonase